MSSLTKTSNEGLWSLFGNVTSCRKSQVVGDLRRHDTRVTSFWYSSAGFLLMVAVSCMADHVQTTLGYSFYLGVFSCLFAFMAGILRGPDLMEEQVCHFDPMVTRNARKLRNELVSDRHRKTNGVSHLSNLVCGLRGEFSEIISAIIWDSRSFRDV